MDLQIQEKILDLIQKSRKPLIVLPTRPDGDALGAGLGLYLFLNKEGKDSAICGLGLDRERYGFLPSFDQVSTEPQFTKSFVISVNTLTTKLKELSYSAEDSVVNIFLKPSEGEFKPEDVSFKSGPSDHDLIICINIQSLDSLGDLYAKNTEVFFGTPLLNIDNNISNENYGVVQAIDLTSASNSEIVLNLIRAGGQVNIDPEIATCLLTGIISATNSFQHNRTTPQAFLSASELIQSGGKQQEIVQHLFKTKHLSVLKLWGRAMARIKNLSESGVVFTALTSQDLERSGAVESEAEKVLKELTANISDVRLLFLCLENNNKIDVYVYAHPNIKLSEILNHFGGRQVSENTGTFVLDNIQLTGVENLIEGAVSNLKMRLGL
jgi:bifunctional oligoribonuclease and PAP phosphatase NrnA